MKKGERRENQGREKLYIVKFHEIGYANMGLPLILSVDPTSSPNVKDGILTSAHQKCEIFHYP